MRAAGRATSDNRFKRLGVDVDVDPDTSSGAVTGVGGGRFD